MNTLKSMKDALIFISLNITFSSVINIHADMLNNKQIVRCQMIHFYTPVFDSPLVNSVQSTGVCHHNVILTTV